MSSVEPEYTQAIVSALEEIMTKDEREDILKDDIDTFRVERAYDKTYEMDALKEALAEEVAEEKATSSEGIVDYNTIVKRLLIHEELPSSKLTPYFNHHAFYANLRRYQSQSKEAVVDFGRSIIYGEVVTSTSSMLEKYVSLWL